MVQSKKRGVFKLNTVEDANKIQIILGGDDTIADVKDDLGFDDDLELNDCDLVFSEFSRSQSSIHTFHLIDESSQS